MTVTGPLSGIKIIDCSEVISGPYGVMILADQGADVIKVEALPRGEETRMLVNYRDGMAALNMNCNHNKRSIGINLKTPEGLEVMYDLVRSADVFVQNWRPGAAGRLKVAEEDLRKINPDIVYASISGYGETGPYADRRGYDPIFQAMTGWVSAQFNPEIPFPDLVRNSIVDKVTSMTLAQGVTAALLARAMGGEPQHVKVAMLDVALAGLWPDGMLRHTLVGDDVQNFVVPGERYQVTNTADGQLVMWMSTSQQMRDGLRAVGRDDLADDPSQQGRAMLAEESVTARAVAMSEGLSNMTTADAETALLQFEVPVASVASVEDALSDPQLRHNGSIIEDEHPQWGKYRRAAPAARFSSLPFEHDQHPPLFAEHTDEILAELHYDAAKRESLRAAGAIAPQ